MTHDINILGEIKYCNDHLKDYDQSNDPYYMTGTTQPILVTQILAIATWHRVNTRIMI